MTLVGEICVTSIEHEGVMNGYSIPLLKEVLDLTSLPVIINGGAGCYEDFSEAFKKGASATVLLECFFLARVYKQ